MAIRRNSFVNLTSNLVGLVLFAVLTPLYFHVIGSERYGILAIIWAFLSFFTAFDFGMGAALTFRVAGAARADTPSQAEYFWTALSISFPIGLLLGGLLFGSVGGGLGGLFKLSPTVSAELVKSASALLGIGLCTILLSTSGGLLRGREYFVTNAILNSLSLTLAILLPVLAAILISPSVYVLILATLAGRVAIVIATIAFAQIVILRGSRPRVSAKAARSLVGYGAWSSLSGVLELSISSADRFILGAVIGSSGVGYYSVPSSVLARVMVVPTSLGSASLPQMARRSAEEVALLSRKVVRMVVMLTPCFVIGVFLANPFLRIWMGASFASLATLPMQILMPAFWLEAVAAIFFYRLLAQGRPKVNAATAAIIVLPYCTLLYFFAGLWGVAGGAAAYLARNMMYLTGRATATQAWGMLIRVAGLEFLLLAIAVGAVLLSLPNQPPIFVGLLVSAASIVVTLKRRPPEFDRLVRDLLHRLPYRFPYSDQSADRSGKV